MAQGGLEVQAQNKNRMKIKHILFCVSIIVSFLFLEGCKSAKIFPADVPKKNVELASLTNQLLRVQPKINKLTARIKAQYNDGKRKQQVVVQLRMAHQKKIWMSATMLVPIAKILIEPNEVSFYEKFQKNYFQGNFDLINAPLNTQLEYQQIEALLLGKPLLPLQKVGWKLVSHPKDYVLVPKSKKTSMALTLFFDSNSFLLKEQRILVPGTAQTLTINYENHTRVNDQYFPQKVRLSLYDGSELRQVVLEFSRITLPKELTFPFEIPKGYKALRL